MADTPNAEILIAPELMRTILDLPPEYDVQPNCPRCWTIHVALHVAHLPSLPVGEMPHLVKPIYTRVTPTRAELERIEVVPSSERTDRLLHLSQFLVADP